MKNGKENPGQGRERRSDTANAHAQDVYKNPTLTGENPGQGSENRSEQAGTVARNVRTSPLVITGGDASVELGGDTSGGESVEGVTATASTPTVNGQSEFIWYYHPDHLGSTGFVTDQNGELYEHVEYFPFGETWVQEHSNTQRTPYLYTGKELDEETGLYYYGARYYDPRTSVWQSADPILGEYLPVGNKERDNKLAGMGGIYRPININLYRYAGQNPLIYVDPDGNEDLVVVPASTNQVTPRFESKMLVYGNGTISGPKLAFLKLLGALNKLQGGTLTEADVKKVLGDPKGEYGNFSSQPDDPSAMGTIADGQVFDYQQGHTSSGTFGFRLSSAAGKGNVPQDSNANNGINPAHPNRNARVVEGAFIHAARAGAPSAENYVAGSNGCVVGKYSSFFSDLQASPTGATGRFVIFR